ncbi:MAG TPA: PhoU domain-containing protein, partial [Actinomycetota bacterium]|nr:PhoU domain-containing protein [Actinomycetota bacterium]
MPRSHFHEKLEEMEMELLTLGELAGNAVQNSVEAVMQQDDALAERVIAEDDEVDRLYIDLDQQMLSLLALQAPVAADLRLISVVIHSSLHLERVGDQAVNVAKMQQVTRDLPANETILQQIGEMGHIVVEMVRVAMDALRRRDLELS